MKNVVNNQQVVHLWANKRQDSARNSNDSLSFQGDKLYSYGVCIGRHVNTASGAAYLRPTRTYSVTTGKHQSMMRSAASHIQVIRCKALYPDRGFDYFDTENLFSAWFREQAESYKSEAENLKPTIAKAKSKKNYYLRELDDLKTEFETLYEWVKYYAKTLTSGNAYLKSLEAIFDDALKGFEHQDWDALKAAIKEENKKLLERLATRKKAELEQWRSGEVRWLNHTHDATYLRINASHDIETSKGMVIPNREARIAFEAFKRGKMLGLQLLGYTITQVDSEARRVVAGCHSVPFEDIEELGPKLVLLMSA